MSLQSYTGKGKDAGKTFYRIQPYLPDGRRVTIRLGSGQKQAIKAYKAIRDLIDSQKANCDPTAETKGWIENTVKEALCSTLIKCGLIQQLPERLTGAGKMVLAGLCDRYIKQFGAGKKPRTVVAYEQAKSVLVEHFNADTAVDSIDADMARDYWAWMITERNLAPNTAKQRLRYARSMFDLAVESGLLAKNPFRAKGLSVSQTAAVKQYVSWTDIRTIVKYCPTREWKLFFELTRTIPTRIPSEFRELTWADVDWEQNKILIHSPKTRHIGKHARQVPIFDTFGPRLSEAFNQPYDGNQYIFPNIRKLTNVSKLAKDILEKAKVKPWVCFFNSIRASAETDLMDSHGLRLACQWAGNSPATAIKNYSLVRNEDFIDGGNSVIKSDAKSDAIPACDAKSDAESASVPERSSRKKTRKAVSPTHSMFQRYGF